MATTETNTKAVSVTIASMYRGAVSEQPGGGNWAAADGACVTLAFANGKTFCISTDNLPHEIYYRALAHGLSAKLVDATAISRNPDTGRSASVEDKYNAAREVYERLLAGQWNKVRGDGTGTGSGGLLFRALCITYPTKTPEQIRAYLATKNLSEQATMRRSDKLATIIEDLRAKDAANGEPVDEEALFEGLED